MTEKGESMTEPWQSEPSQREPWQQQPDAPPVKQEVGQ